MGYLLEVVELRAQRRGQSRQDGDQLFSRQWDADDARGRRKDLLGRAMEELSRCGAGGAGGGHAWFTGGAVRVAGIDGHDADAAAGGAEMFLVHNKRGRGDAVGCERGGGACGGISHDEGKVCAAALLEAGLGSAKAEAPGDEELGVIRHVGQRI